MQLVLLKNVKGIDKDKNSERLHASAGDVLRVLLRKGNHFICDSINFPNEEIFVFESQVDYIIPEKGGSIEDELLTLEPSLEEIEKTEEIEKIDEVLL
jgi:hypothetical protein